ncbi:MULTISPECIES: phytanoyl-CoA dioxygenase family protein [Paraburkholderia]|uniref:phytanoyl-CoA dioxygenase family protein n=1 Tax=Paraburkholderia TaxID=1822464 RepID=UPI000940FDAE
MSASNGGTGVVPGSHLVKDDSTDDAIWPTVFAGTGLAIHSATLHGSSPNRSEQERDIIVIQFGWSRSCLRSRAQDVLSLASLDDFQVFAQDHLTIALRLLTIRRLSPIDDLSIHPVFR